MMRTPGSQIKPIDGRQRLRNIETKTRIVAARRMRAFMAGAIEVLPCSGDYEREQIAREFDRLSERETDKDHTP